MCPITACCRSNPVAGAVVRCPYCRDSGEANHPSWSRGYSGDSNCDDLANLLPCLGELGPVRVWHYSGSSSGHPCELRGRRIVRRPRCDRAESCPRRQRSAVQRSG